MTQSNVTNLVAEHGLNVMPPKSLFDQRVMTEDLDRVRFFYLLNLIALQ